MSKQVKNPIETLKENITKKHGDTKVYDIAQRLGKPHPSLPTGIFIVDKLLSGCDGLPRERMVEIFGAEGHGKTTLTLQIIAAVQALGGNAAFIDVERAFNPQWAATLGVDLHKLLYLLPDTGEEAFDMVEQCVDSKMVDIIVMDSLAAISPKREFDEDVDKDSFGIQARLIGRGLRKLTPKVHSANCVVVFINQLRDNTKMASPFDKQYTVPGGRGPKHYCSVRWFVKRVKQLKDGEDVIGSEVLIINEKNRMGNVVKSVKVDFINGLGIDSVSTLFDRAVETGHITKSGATFGFNEQKLGVGRRQAIETLRENAGLVMTLEELCSPGAEELETVHSDE